MFQKITRKFSSKQFLNFNFISSNPKPLDKILILNSPETVKIQNFVNKDTNIVFSDGGVNRIKEFGLTDKIIKNLKSKPQVIGDFDSLKEFNKEKFQYFQNSDQDLNDMEKSLQYIQKNLEKEKNNPREILIVGILGGRFDHTMYLIYL